MPPDVASVRSWLAKADHERRRAEAALAQTPPITDTAAFHCQQAVEKLLKAYLVHCVTRLRRFTTLRCC
ncbi:MAG: HEPN domain-containing protein [Phycisphaerae bacterium]